MGNPVVEFQMLSRAPEETAQFYCDLFDWTVDAANPMGYRRVHTGSAEGISGGIWPAPPQAPAFVQLFMAVENVQETVKRAQELGAKLLIPPVTLPEGDEMAVLHDPQGMSFAVWRKGSKS